jgi:putative transposase
MRRAHFQNQEFEWQDGYGIFSVSESCRETVEKYILNQKEHHAGKNFEAEYEGLIRKHGFEYNPWVSKDTMLSNSQIGE